MLNKFLPRWEFYENTVERPSRCRNIIHADYADYRHFIAQQSDEFVDQIVNSLYNGDVYILKQAFDPAWMREIREKAIAYWDTKPSEFYQMLEGTPDFHRKIDLETGKKYSFQVCKQSCFFYPWNDDPLELFFTVYKRWRVIKTLMGLQPDAYEKNTPRAGVVDRIQIANYPPSIGFLEPHSDPYLHQRLFFSGYMSKRGEDYEKGGFYLVGRENQILEAEENIEVGDIGIGYATVYHGVAPSDRNSEPVWDGRGRWFLSMYSNASDEVKDRHTGHPVKLDIPEVMP